MHWRRQWQPLQCSCLENPRDGGAWWAAIYGVAQSRTRLKWLSLVSLNLTLVSWVLIYRNVFIFFFSGSWGITKALLSHPYLPAPALGIAAALPFQEKCFALHLHCITVMYPSLRLSLWNLKDFESHRSPSFQLKHRSWWRNIAGEPR